MCEQTKTIPEGHLKALSLLSGSGGGFVKLYSPGGRCFARLSSQEKARDGPDLCGDGWRAKSRAVRTSRAGRLTTDDRRDPTRPGLMARKLMPMGAEGGSRGRLWRAVEDGSAPGDLEVAEARLGDHRSELCFQQSAGHSALPQVDVALGAIGDRVSAPGCRRSAAGRRAW